MSSCCKADEEAVAKAIGRKSVAGRFLAAAGKLQELLESWPFLVVAGVSLAASFLLAGHGCAEHAAKALTWRDPAWVALAICGVPILKEALMALAIEKRIRASLLISIAMVACVLIGQLFAAGEVAFIMALGETLEGWTLRRAKKGLSNLVALAPRTARRVTTCPKCIARGELYKEVDIAAIAVGDGVRILPGETIPVDGKIEEGTTSVDQSVMTGESLPVDKGVGDEVYSGTINRFGAITIRVTKAGEDSSLQKMIRLVMEAEKKKAPVQRIADKWAAILVPCSLTIALATFFGVWIATGDVNVALIRGTTVMVVFCPCALALATPTAIMAAIGQATKFGVIVKSGEALERMGGVDVACFDKTGTLTAGRLAVAATVAAPGESEAEVLALAAAVERSSEHPLAQAVCRAVADAPQATDFRMEPGKGVEASVRGRRVVCGNEAWLAAHGIAGDAALGDAAKKLRMEGRAVIHVAADGKAIGLVALADTVRPDAKAMLAELQAAGVESVLLTGDHAATARYVAAGLGIRDVRAELLPSGKADEIARLVEAGKSVAMVGDGVNDALALKTATVGLAMGGMGSDIAVEAADIALVGDDLTKIPYLKRLAAACVRLIKFNIAISMCINACAIACSILGVLTPVTGALVHNMGSVLVVLNAALLYDRDYRQCENVESPKS